MCDCWFFNLLFIILLMTMPFPQRYFSFIEYYIILDTSLWFMMQNAKLFTVQNTELYNLKLRLIFQLFLEVQYT